MGLFPLGLEKRSPALQGCNRTRNIQADGAPRVHRASCGLPPQEAVFFTIGHRSYASENPPSQHAITNSFCWETLPAHVPGLRRLTFVLSGDRQTSPGDLDKVSASATRTVCRNN